MARPGDSLDALLMANEIPLLKNSRVLVGDDNDPEEKVSMFSPRGSSCCAIKPAIELSQHYGRDKLKCAQACIAHWDRNPVNSKYQE